MKRYLPMALLAAFLAAACEGPVTEEEYIHHDDPVIPVPASLSLTSPTVNVDYMAGVMDSTLVVTDQESFSIDVSAEAAAWLTVEVKDNKIRVTAMTANDGYVERTGVITVIAGTGLNASSAEFSVVQAGSPRPVLRLSAAEVQVGNTTGNTATLNVTETNLETLNVTVDATWCSASLNGSIITLTVLEDNPVEEIRTATLTVDGIKTSVPVTVTQQAALPPSKVGQAYGTEGIYYWRNPDNPNEYMVLSKYAELRQWGPSHTAGCPGTTYDMVQSCANIRNNTDYATESYALQFCDDLGEGWMLPSQSEAENLFEAYNSLRFDNKKGPATIANPNAIKDEEKAARAAFEAVLASIEGVPLNSQPDSSSGDSIWLCAENTAGTNGWYFRFGSVGLSHGTKTSSTRYARCVKKVTVE